MWSRMADPMAGVEPPLRYLCRSDVMMACREVDPVQVVRDALELHAEGRTTLPDEAYLGWRTADGQAAG